MQSERKKYTASTQICLISKVRVIGPFYLGASTYVYYDDVISLIAQSKKEEKTTQPASTRKQKPTKIERWIKVRRVKQYPFLLFHIENHVLLMSLHSVRFN